MDPTTKKTLQQLRKWISNQPEDYLNHEKARKFINAISAVVDTYEVDMTVDGKKIKVECRKDPDTGEDIITPVGHLKIYETQIKHREAAKTELKEHDRVETLNNTPHIAKGTVGVIVHCYPKSFEVEFPNGDVQTLNSYQIRLSR